MPNFLSTLAATLISIVATWFFAWLYYRRAGNELQRETEELRRLTNLILRAMENAGFVKINRDASGRPLGFIFEAQVTFGAGPSLKTGGSAETTSTPAQP